MAVVINNVRVGTPDVDLARAAHVPGVREGNERGSYEREPGLLPGGRVRARRSTGINPEARNPIDPRMPNLPPA
jgi:hypothetical protein